MSEKTKNTIFVIAGLVIGYGLVYLLWSLLFGATAVLPGSVVGEDGRRYLQCGRRLVPIRYTDKDGREIKPDVRARTGSPARRGGIENESIR